MIGRAVDGAESSLNEDLFFEADIGADAITQLPPLFCEDFQRSVYYWLQKVEVLSAAIVCCVVVVDSSTSVEDINQSLLLYGLEVRQGKWIITMVENSRFNLLNHIVGILRRYGVMKKGFLVEVKKGEKWKSVDVLLTIVDRLHHL